MLVRRYQGRNEKEAIDKAKADLGADGVILHIKQLSKNGIFDLKSAAKVEVIVALGIDIHGTAGTASAECGIHAGAVRTPSQRLHDDRASHAGIDLQIAEVD